MKIASMNHVKGVGGWEKKVCEPERGNQAARGAQDSCVSSDSTRGAQFRDTRKTDAYNSPQMTITGLKTVRLCTAAPWLAAGEAAAPGFAPGLTNLLRGVAP